VRWTPTWVTPVLYFGEFTQRKELTENRLKGITRASKGIALLAPNPRPNAQDFRYTPNLGNDKEPPS